MAGVRKQLDIYFRYWSNLSSGICVRFYKSFLLGHATADIISRPIIDSLKADGIDISRMLMLGMCDFPSSSSKTIGLFTGRGNPNVNKSIEDRLNKEVIAERKARYSYFRKVFSFSSLQLCITAYPVYQRWACCRLVHVHCTSFMAHFGKESNRRHGPSMRRWMISGSVFLAHLPGVKIWCQLQITCMRTTAGSFKVSLKLVG